jgi:hypothetical protein
LFRGSLLRNLNLAAFYFFFCTSASHRAYCPYPNQIDYTKPKIPSAGGNETSNATLAVNNTNSSNMPPTILPGGATVKDSSGKALIDMIFSHPAVSAESAGPKGQDGRDLGFMRKALHAIGEKYGFLDITTPAFSVGSRPRVVSCRPACAESRGGAFAECDLPSRI